MTYHVHLCDGILKILKLDTARHKLLSLNKDRESLVLDEGAIGLDDNGSMHKIFQTKEHQMPVVIKA